MEPLSFLSGYKSDRGWWFLRREPGVPYRRQLTSIICFMESTATLVSHSSISQTATAMRTPDFTSPMRIKTNSKNWGA